MNIRAAVLAVPVTLALAGAVASASSVSLTTLAPVARDHVASLGDTCAIPFAPAQLSAAFFQYPSIAANLHAQGVATVGVSLSSSGRVLRAWPIKSSGNHWLDAAAMDTARESSYIPGRAECNPAGGDYKINVDFSLDS